MKRVYRRVSKKRFYHLVELYHLVPERHIELVLQNLRKKVWFGNMFYARWELPIIKYFVLKELL